jgi:L-threonylcarbamoyladenylate synthase
MKTRILPSGDPNTLITARELIRAGQLVAFPTDTVYGVAAAVFDPQAIEGLFDVKDRERSKAIPVLLSDQDELPRVTARASDMAERLARQFWPGPLTLVVPKHPALPSNLSPFSTVGVRVPDHPVALALLKQSGPLAVTSANLSGQPNCKNAFEVYAQLESRIPLIIDGGKTPGGAPSTVVDCTQDEPFILRSGPLSLERIREALL